MKGYLEREESDERRIIDLSILRSTRSQEQTREMVASLLWL
jgi:hypothetical protein